MPTNNPISSITFNTWLSPNANVADNEGLLLAQYLKGGYQTVITFEDRDAIPIYLEGSSDPHAGFTSSGDEGKTTGRRSLGMMVHVVDPAGDGSIEPKTYVLLPLGYFGNDGNLGWDTWSSRPEWEKAKRMKPSATVYTNTSDGGFGYLEYTLPEPQTEDDCWFELVHPIELPSGGSEGQVLSKIDNLDYNVQWSDPQGGTGNGEAGAQGDPGVQGAQGAQGADGVQGAQGADGVQGAQGADGVQGAQGADGVQGAQGAGGSFAGESCVYNQATYTALPEPNDYLAAQDQTQGHVEFFGAGLLNDINQIYLSETGQLAYQNFSVINNSTFLDSIQSAGGALITIVKDGGAFASYICSTITSHSNVNDIATYSFIDLVLHDYVGNMAYNNNDDPILKICLAPLMLGNQGADGVQGAQGAQGDLGIQGAQGAVGVQGAQGATGELGPQGLTGAIGAQGPLGPTGPQGEQGIQGAQGAQGADGVQGAQGATGAQGIPGTAAAEGAQGAQGADGVQGAQGADGIQGAQGEQGIQGAQGADGIQGAQGADGIQGAQGEQGIQGAQGADGVQGAQGADGVQGAQGADGIQGAQGEQGIQGAQGAASDVAGPQGAQGDIGQQGAQGEPGTAAAEGAQGAQGADGIQGAQGEQGIQGAQGADGVQGAQGADGIQGAQGEQGIQGAQGAASDVAGPQGAQGDIGQQGAQGEPGTAAAEGAQGAQGADGEFDFIGLMLDFSLGQGLAIGSGTYDVFDGDVFRIEGYGTGQSFANGLYVATQDFTIDLNTTVGAAQLELLSFYNSSFEDFVFDGDVGAQGAQGDAGVQGAQGAQGADGVQGAQGADGVQGAQGADGVQGAQGADGPCITVVGGALNNTTTPGVISSDVNPFATPGKAIFISKTIGGVDLTSYLGACEGTGMMVLSVFEQANPSNFVIFTIDTTSGGLIANLGQAFSYTYSSFSGTITNFTQGIDYCIDITCYGLDGEQGAQGAPGSGGGGGTGVYVMKLEYSAFGGLQSVLAAQDPSGTNILNQNGFTFTITNSSAGTVDFTYTDPNGHSLSIINVYTHAQLNSGSYFTRASTGLSTNDNGVINLNGAGQFTQLNQSYIGLEGTIAYVTWQFSDNEILI